MRDKEVIELFRCKHVEDCKPVDANSTSVIWSDSNLIMRLIANQESPYKFSSQCLRNSNNQDDWEYIGFGHSGAASIVAALLEQLQALKQENEELRTERDRYEEALKEIRLTYFNKHGGDGLKAAYDIAKQALEIKEG